MISGGELWFVVLIVSVWTLIAIGLVGILVNNCSRGA